MRLTRRRRPAMNGRVLGPGSSVGPKMKLERTTTAPTPLPRTSDSASPLARRYAFGEAGSAPG